MKKKITLNLCAIISFVTILLCIGQVTYVPFVFEGQALADENIIKSGSPQYPPPQGADALEALPPDAPQGENVFSFDEMFRQDPSASGIKTPEGPIEASPGEVRAPSHSEISSSGRGPSTKADQNIPEKPPLERPETTIEPLPGKVDRKPVRPIESEIIYSHPKTSDHRELTPSQRQQIGKEMSDIRHTAGPEPLPSAREPSAGDKAPLSEIYRTPRTPTQRDSAFKGALDRAGNLIDPHGLSEDALAATKEKLGLGDLPETLKTGEDNLRSAFQSENQKRIIDAVRKVGGNDRAVDQLNKLDPEMIKLRERYVKVKNGITNNTIRNLKQRLAKTYDVSIDDVEVFTTSTKKVPLDQTGGVPRAGHDTDFGAKVKGIEVDHNTLRKHLAPAYGDAVLDKNMNAAGLAKDNIKAMSRLSPERISDLNILKDPTVRLKYPHATGEDLGNKVYSELYKSHVSASKGQFSVSESQKLDAYRELNKIGKIARGRFKTGKGKLTDQTKRSLELLDEMINPRFPGDRPATPQEIDRVLAQRKESLEGLTNKVVSNIQGSEVLRPPGQQVSDKVRMDEFVERIKGKVELNRLKQAARARRTGKFEPIETSRGHAETKTGYEDLRKTGGKQSFQGDPSQVTGQAGRGHADTPTGYEDLHQRPVDKKTGLRGKSSFKHEISPRKVIGQAVGATIISGIAAKTMTDKFGKAIDQSEEASYGDMALETAKGLAMVPGIMELERRNLASEYRKVVEGKQTESEAKWNAFKKTADDILLRPGRDVVGRNIDDMYAKAKAEGKKRPGMGDAAWMLGRTTLELIGKYSGMETLGEAFSDTTTFEQRGDLAGQKKYMDQFTASRLTQRKVKMRNLLSELEDTIKAGSADDPATSQRVLDVLNRYDHEYQELQNLAKMARESKGKVDPSQVKRVEQELELALDPDAMRSHARYLAGEKDTGDLQFQPPKLETSYKSDDVVQRMVDPYGMWTGEYGDSQLATSLSSDSSSGSFDATPEIPENEIKSEKILDFDGDQKDIGDFEREQEQEDKQQYKAEEEESPFSDEKSKIWLGMMDERESQLAMARNMQMSSDAQSQAFSGTSQFNRESLEESLKSTIDTIAAPTGCSHNSDCPSGYHCRNHQCVPRSCGKNSDCPEGYVCRNGECIELRPDEKPPGCSKNSDCPEGYACRDSQCVELRPDEDKIPPGCSKNSDCPEGYACRDSQCVELRPDEDKIPPGCSKNSDCPEGYACRDSQCVGLRPDEDKIPPGCSKNSDCPVGYACRDSQCVELRPDEDKIPPGCSKNSDCPVGYACRDSQCVKLRPDEDKIPSSCSKNSDCPEGYACRDSQCVKLRPDVETPVSCSVDRDCPEGYLCIKRECSKVSYYLAKWDLYFRINGIPCKTAYYSCAEITEKDLDFFMSLARNLYRNAIGVIESGGAEEDQCVKTQELVDVKETIVQGPSKTPITVPRPSTDCPCKDSPSARYNLNSEYDPNCTPYEEVQKAKELIHKQ